jgi:hypothetical protein
MSDTRDVNTDPAHIDLAKTDPAETDLAETDLVEDDPVDFVSGDEDRTFPERPCGDPAMHDRLLTLLRRYHPEGHQNVVEPGSRRLPWRVTAVEKSLTGCSASLCADAA